MRILVTGAAGFIGSHLAERLLGRGHRVLGLDNFDPYYDRAVKERNLATCLAHGAFAFEELDILDAQVLGGLFARFQPDVCVHLAALAGVQPSLARPADYQRVNVVGTTNVLEACRDAGCEHLVFASSSSVYGDASHVPFTEEDPCLHPVSPYAASKRAAELACWTHHHLHGLHVTVLRFFTVYGPRQRPEMAVARFVRQILAGEPIVLYGDGQSARDYTYIEDILAGVVRAAETRPTGYRVYNLGNNTPIRLLDLVGAIERAVGRKALIRHAPARPGDVRITWADVTRARRDLGYDPKTSLDEGLARYVAWWHDSARRKGEKP